MRGNVIYTECHRQIWIDTALRLQEDLGCRPAYWVGTTDFEPRVREHFPDAIFHARNAAIRGVPPPALASMPQRGIGQDVIQAFAATQITALHMMDRLDTGGAFSYHERVEYFVRQLRYWRTIFERIEPEYVVFPVQPHMVYDFIVYELCKHYGVKTCMFQWTPLPNVVFPLTRLEEPSATVADSYRRLVSAPPATLSQRVETYVGRITADYGTAMPEYVAKTMPVELRRRMLRGGGALSLGGHQGSALNAPPVGVEAWPEARIRRTPSFSKRIVRARKDAARAGRRAARAWELTTKRMRWSSLRRRSRDVRRNLRRAAKRWIVAPVRGFMAGGSARPLKERGRPFETSFAGRFGVFRLLLTRVRGQRYKRELRRHYDRLAQAVTLDAPYVFVALHYQPEQTTCPTGSVFTDQFVMVDMIARSIPAGWSVYVKEHPYQFFSASVGERGRSTELYDELAALPNVRLVPYSMSPFDLIDRAQAVATVTGTAGIEAVLRGRPTVVFGYAWYRGCEGVYYAPSVAQCADAFTRIAGGATVDVSKVKLFLAAIEDAGYEVDLGFGTETEVIAPDVNAERVSAAIVSSWRSMAPPAAAQMASDRR